MEEKRQFQHREPTQKHHSQTFWQIYLPLIITGAAAALGIYQLLNGSRAGALDLRVWADIAAILVVLPLFFILLFLLIFSLLGSFGLLKISSAAHDKLPKANQLAARLAGWMGSLLANLGKTVVEAEVYSSLLSRKKKSDAKEGKYGREA